MKRTTPKLLRRLASYVIVASLLTLIGAGPAGAQTTDESHVDHCVACHTEEDYLPEGFFKDDVHMQHGLSCAGCHGGDPTSADEEQAMSKEKGFVGVPSKEEIPEFCGKCHSDINFMREYQPRIPTDQVSQYYTSLHGMRLVKGDKKVADCTSCHTAHAILAAHDARSTVYPINVPKTCSHCHADPDYMAPYSIPTNQFAKYKDSVHGKALLEDQDTGAPACNDCHGNHGAMPPGITAIRQVCGNCHVNNMKFFSASKMGEAFEEEELHGCEECHGNHDVHKTSDNMVGTSDDAVCLDCHSAGDKGYKAAGAIHDLLTKLVGRYDEGVTLQAEVRKIGMDDVDIEYLLKDAHQSLIKARTLVHTFDPDKVAPTTQDGTQKADSAITLAGIEIEEHHIRRRGFGMATLFTTILIIALFLKIRQMEAA